MIRYELADSDRTLMKPYSRVVQAAIAIEANKLMGILNVRPQAIGKYEGGVIVNNCEICIKYDFLCDDWKRTNLNNPTPEEIATVKAIDIVARLCRFDVSELSKYEKIFGGDSLRSMFS